MKNPLSKISAVLVIALLIVALPLMGKVDPDVFKALKARSIGPANMSGRVASIDAVQANPDIIYVGAATGGLWKSQNGGITWEPIFDDQPASSIGAVQIFQANPNIVWVGTGEANPRNSVGVGRGVFKSLDGGKTWTNLGLEKTEKISRILLDQSNPDVAFVAAMGTTWGENQERGIFKTTDGGKTWDKILYVDEKTGAADLVMEPGNPNKLIAAMWEHRRWPWFFNSGGPGSGIHITIDGGKTWKRLTDKDGLPQGILGRIGLAFAHNKTNIVYALVEAKKDVLLRSEDGGFKWRTVNKKSGVNGRAFYYCDIRVNPKNENIVYSLQSRMKVSEDGGKSFRSLASFGQSHSDYHAMWNHPNGEHMIVGNDGGVVLTRDRGKNWLFVGNLPLAQFYHISFDDEFPYNVYGGLQDNGSWRGPSNVLTDRGIYAHHWRMVGFGDGFDTEPDPRNSKRGFGMSQGGALYYFNAETGLRKSIRPTESDVKHRFHWNAGLAIDPLEIGTVYYGSQFVHKTTDNGNSWEIISPDLTTNDPEKQKQAESGGLSLDVTNAENHTCIITIAPSPRKKGVIWVGTDDGNVQLTQDGGKTWELVSKSITAPKGKKGKSKKGKKSKKRNLVPYGTWVPHIEASKFDPASAFVVFDDHRRANWTSYVYATHDYGKTWKALSPDQIDGFVHVIEQDHVDKDLLFLGTEFGMHVSFNGGRDWMKWTHGMPTVPVRDMNIHPRDNDLVIGTHGRAAYILDDITPLREIDETLLKKTLHLFHVNDAYMLESAWAPALVSPGNGTFRGQNRRGGAYITFLWNPPKDKLKDTEKREKRRKSGKRGMERGKGNRKGKGKSKLKIEILDKDGKVIRDIEASPKKGINRISWNFRGKSFKRPGSSGRRGRGGGGLRVLPGNYTVRFTYGKTVLKQSFNVKYDPRLKFDRAAAEKNYKVSLEIGGWLNALDGIYKQIEKTKKTIGTVKSYAGNLDKKVKKELLKKGKELKEKLDKLYKKIFYPRPRPKGIRDNSHLLMSKMYGVFGGYFGEFEPATQASEKRYNKFKPLIEKILKEANVLFSTDVKEYQEAVKKSGFSIFKPFKPITFEDKDEEEKEEKEG